MNDPVRFRRARASEPLETYAFVAAWPVLWLLPYGLWTWVIALAPGVLTSGLRKYWRSRAPIVATAKRSGSGVALLDESGRRVDGFEDREVEAVTSVVDTKRRTVDLRVDLKGPRALIFEVTGDDEDAIVARRLGVDIKRARSRYQGGSLALRPLALPFFVGVACMLYALFGKPDADTAVWLTRINLFGLLPVLLLINIPTTIDVGRDGVAWRWLFLRNYVAFASMVSMVPFPKDAIGEKVASMKFTKRDGVVVQLLLGKKAPGAAEQLLAEFVASNRAAPAAPIDDWLPRGATESALVWIQRLRARSTPGGTYRGSDVLHLWPLAEDLTTPHDLRCAILFVLGTTDVARARIRALAAQVVDPEVQAVFEAIANGASDEEVALLLGRVSNTTPA